MKEADRVPFRRSHRRSLARNTFYSCLDDMPHICAEPDEAPGCGGPVQDGVCMQGGRLPREAKATCEGMYASIEITSDTH